MDAKELMIGDWVNHLNNPRKVTGAIDFTFAKDFEPILLTTEILEKNGFKRYYESGFFSYNEEGLTFGCMNKYYATNVFGKMVTLYYVHELQHALRLCGLNDLADNFKI